jgi:hypothetical protein
MRTRSERGLARGPRRAGALLVALALLVAPAAHAHAPGSPLGMTLSVRPARVDLIVRYAIADADEARAAREQFDRDADGTLAEPEAEALEHWMVARVRRWVGLTLRDEALTLTVASASHDFAAGLEVQVVLRAPVRWRAGGNRVRVLAEVPGPAVTPVIVLDRRGRRSVVWKSGEASRGAPLELDVPGR